MMVVPLACAMALGTALLGWWAVPLLGLIYGAWRGAEKGSAVAAAGALLGWSVVMLWNWTEGPVAELAGSLGAIMGLPGWALLLATALFPAVLAGTAAVVGAAIGRVRSS